MASLSENVRKTLNDYDEKILDIYNQIENLPSVPGGGSGVGDLENLETNDKSSVVNAINEIAEEHGQDIAEMSNKIDEIYNTYTNYGDSKIKPSDNSLFIFTELGDGNYSVSAKNTELSGEIVIPYSYNGKEVVAISEYGFQNCVDITKIVIPNTVTTIKGYAFLDCKNLVSLIIPVSVKTIESDYISGCSRTEDNKERIVDIYFKGSYDQWNSISNASCYEDWACEKYFNFAEVEDLTYLITDNKSSFVEAINEVYQNARNAEIRADYVFAELGYTENLETDNKENLIEAINEVNGKVNVVDERVSELHPTVIVDTEAETSIILVHNVEKRCGTLTNLSILSDIPTDMSEIFMSSIKFTSGETATVLEYPEEIKMTGEDCIDGRFVPIANKRYNIIFDFDGVYLIGVVGGVSI